MNWYGLLAGLCTIIALDLHYWLRSGDRRKTLSPAQKLCLILLLGTAVGGATFAYRRAFP